MEALNPSFDAYEALEKTATELGISCLGIERILHEDEVQDARKAVLQAIRKLQEHGAKHVVVDITGGNKPMSIGAFMAAEELAVDSLYVSSDYDTKLRKPDMNTAKIRRISEAH